MTCRLDKLGTDVNGKSAGSLLRNHPIASMTNTLPLSRPVVRAAIDQRDHPRFSQLIRFATYADQYGSIFAQHASGRLCWPSGRAGRQNNWLKYRFQRCVILSGQDVSSFGRPFGLVAHGVGPLAWTAELMFLSHLAGRPSGCPFNALPLLTSSLAQPLPVHRP